MTKPFLKTIRVKIKKKREKCSSTRHDTLPSRSRTPLRAAGGEWARREYKPYVCLARCNSRHRVSYENYPRRAASRPGPNDLSYTQTKFKMNLNSYEISNKIRSCSSKDIPRLPTQHTHTFGVLQLWARHMHTKLSLARVRTHCTLTHYENFLVSASVCVKNSSVRTKVRIEVFGGLSLCPWFFSRNFKLVCGQCDFFKFLFRTHGQACLYGARLCRCPGVLCAWGL